MDPEWMELAKKELKGKDPETLVHENYEVRQLLHFKSVIF